jgi:2'-5' RNA ligase
MPTLPVESALVALIPAAESLVSCYRERYDPAAGWGVPAHVTVLYPFKAPEDITDDILATLTNLFSGHPAFNVSFTKTMEFPDTLFLEPDPAEPFRELTRAIAAAYPETPPYGGAFKQIVPHLTVAQSEDHEEMDKIRAEFLKDCANGLPVTARVDEVVLMDNASGRWEVRARFPLAGG